MKIAKLLGYVHTYPGLFENGAFRPRIYRNGHTRIRTDPELFENAPESESASVLSALKNGLVANLSDERQLAVAKLSTKRNFSLAKRDILVANGRMVADFSSPAQRLLNTMPRPGREGLVGMITSRGSTLKYSSPQIKA